MHHDKFQHGPRGEFRGDFTRDTFDPNRHFSRVLMQQGRVQLDADWNEQVSIFSYYLRNLASDLIGPHGTPADQDGKAGDGFEIEINERKINVLPGRYYVQGILCQNDRTVSLEAPDDLPFPYLVYLDVWERHLTYVEDDYMREVALTGPDTAARAQIIWQIKLHAVETTGVNFKNDYQAFLNELGETQRPGSGRLRARARKDDGENEPCLTAPESRYRGVENQLYRVEIHNGGSIGPAAHPVTFKWSRENGSVIFPVKKIAGEVVSLEHTGRDKRFSLKPNDWVEVVDDDYILQNHSEELLQVVAVDHQNLQVTLSGTPAVDSDDPDKHPYLRRWDQQEGDANGIPVVTTPENSDDGWLMLEDGVQIQFPAPGNNEGYYHTGDYWLIPARTATGDVEWPGPVTNPDALMPHGTQHYYAPLALVTGASGLTDLRRKLSKGWK